ncbi:hypothetical protein PsorP6_005416 [Peronosclerospora sorghi]|uniref:Uncharacterized protein n=1 Tax=Peronosclerospora sorghi TaxID=230839 RepID=A0ACC0W590_9STRA|nr:hypothetical protein PsorP6_005416 [Peronosclerospora sorghi]
MRHVAAVLHSVNDIASKQWLGGAENSYKEGTVNSNVLARINVPIDVLERINVRIEQDLRSWPVPVGAMLVAFDSGSTSIPETGAVRTLLDAEFSSFKAFFLRFRLSTSSGNTGYAASTDERHNKPQVVKPPFSRQGRYSPTKWLYQGLGHGRRHLVFTCR